MFYVVNVMHNTIIHTSLVFLLNGKLQIATVENVYAPLSHGHHTLGIFVT